MGSVNPGFPPLPAGETAGSIDAAFKAAQPKAVQAFMENPERSPADASTLAAAGYVIDMDTMYWGWEYTAQTQNRIAQGYTWVPAVGQPPVMLSPGLTLQGYQPYNSMMIPAGAIVVTLNPALFPAIYAPKPGSAAAAAVAEGK